MLSDKEKIRQERSGVNCGFFMIEMMKKIMEDYRIKKWNFKILKTTD